MRKSASSKLISAGLLTPVLEHVVHLLGTLGPDRALLLVVVSISHVIFDEVAAVPHSLNLLMIYYILIPVSFKLALEQSNKLVAIILKLR